MRFNKIYYFIEAVFLVAVSAFAANADDQGFVLNDADGYFDFKREFVWGAVKLGQRLSRAFPGDAVGSVAIRLDPQSHYLLKNGSKVSEYIAVIINIHDDSFMEKYRKTYANVRGDRIIAIDIPHNMEQTFIAIVDGEATGIATCWDVAAWRNCTGDFVLTKSISYSIFFPKTWDMIDMGKYVKSLIFSNFYHPM